MKLNIPIILLMLIILIACASNYSQSNAFICEEPGTIGSDRVSNPTQGFDISFQYYLPPCYGEETGFRFPVIYLITMPLELRLNANDNTPMSLADRLIHAGMIPPTIIIIPDDTVAQGYHTALAIDLVAYVDKNFNTIRDRQYRGVGGISHGAGIATRMAFQFPDVFGSLGVFSGGIDKSEEAAFKKWIAATSPENYPRVLISIGDQDGMMPFTQNLMDVLDSQHIRYKLNIETGDHNWEFWSAHIESYLLWFSEVWD